MTTPLPILTVPALVATLADDPVCPPCSGRGGIIVDDPRNPRTCPTCRGRGVTPTPRHIVRTHLRQIARETHA